MINIYICIYKTMCMYRNIERREDNAKEVPVGGSS